MAGPQLGTPRWQRTRIMSSKQNLVNQMYLRYLSTQDYVGRLPESTRGWERERGSHWFLCEILWSKSNLIILSTAQWESYQIPNIIYVDLQRKSRWLYELWSKCFEVWLWPLNPMLLEHWIIGNVIAQGPVHLEPWWIWIKHNSDLIWIKCNSIRRQGLVPSLIRTFAVSRIDNLS